MDRQYAIIDTIKQYDCVLAATPGDYETLHRRGLARLTIAAVNGDLNLMNDCYEDFATAITYMQADGKQPLQATRSLEVVRRARLYLERLAMGAYWQRQLQVPAAELPTGE